MRESTGQIHARTPSCGTETGRRKKNTPEERMPERGIRGTRPPHDPPPSKGSKHLPPARANTPARHRPGRRRRGPRRAKPRRRTGWGGGSGGDSPLDQPLPDAEAHALQLGSAAAVLLQDTRRCRFTPAAAGRSPERPRPHSPLRPARRRGTAPPPSRCAAGGKALRPPSPLRSGAPGSCRRRRLSRR